MWANSKKVIKTQEVLLNDYLTLEKIQSDVVDKDIVDIGDYADDELFGRVYEFNLKTIQPDSSVSNLNTNEFQTNTPHYANLCGGM